MKRNTKEKIIFTIWAVLSFVMWLLFFIMFMWTYEEQLQCTPSQEHQEVMSWINEILQKLD